MSLQAILAPGAQEERQENARMSNSAGAIALKELLQSTLGPKGMDKILQGVTNSKDVIITNDGATIVKALAADNAAAKILINLSITQDQEVGDGTTSVVVFAGELLAEAEKLINKKIHPQTIIMGYRLSQAVALEALMQSTRDHFTNKDIYMKDLLNIAQTTLSSKILSQDREMFAKIAVDAVLKQGEDVNIDSIGFLKKLGGTLRDSYLDEGYLLPKAIGVGQPKRMDNAKIMIANTAMDADKIKIYGAKVKTGELQNVIDVERAEKEKMTKKVERICASGCNVFVNRLLIYNHPEQLFAERGVMAIEHAEFEGIERLALVTGAEIVGDFRDGMEYKLGSCKLIEEILIGEDRVVKFSGLPKAGASTIVLRGANKHVLDEAERSLHDALCVLQQAVKDHRVICGGGCAEMQMARAVEEEANRTEGKKQLAMMGFANALRQMPTHLADNAGLDSQELVSKLRTAHFKHAESFNKGATKESCVLGLDLDRGEVADMEKLGVVEPVRVKSSMLNSASEAAELILRVDTIVTSAPRQRREE
ncbi:MAG: putative T-complex protein 1 subunit beta [Streblomastix strix]|uniref:CCT-beta n=1 Tax=Streblomastix strix TaxID=222440 RepID=A0A5J4W1F5_9EUKA|nr:MAG: putative T-complex protein 1 subunit beta [Streblomastix strix]